MDSELKIRHRFSEMLIGGNNRIDSVSEWQAFNTLEYRLGENHPALPLSHLEFGNYRLAAK